MYFGVLVKQIEQSSVRDAIAFESVAISWRLDCALTFEGLIDRKVHDHVNIVLHCDVSRLSRLSRLSAR